MNDGARLPGTHPLGRRLIAAIKGGDVEDLQAMLADDPALARCLVEDADGGWPLRPCTCSPTHPEVDPAHPETLTALVAAGADPDAAAEAMWHRETPLHWAASNDDIVLIDALLDAGADIEAPGSSIGGGPPIQSAVGYGMYRAVARLYERGAQVTLVHYVVLGLVDHAREAAASADQDQLDSALWNACSRGDTVIARMLIGLGAHLYWSAPWNGQTPLDAARAEQQTHLLELLSAPDAQAT